MTKADHPRPRPCGRRAVRAGLAALLFSAAIPTAAAAARPEPASGRERPAAAAAPAPATAASDPGLNATLDAIVGASPPATCLSVALDGVAIYQHRGSDPMVPASTEKLVTAEVALDQLGADHRFDTRVVASAPAAGGVVQGDLTLVGGGDPSLVTDVYRLVRRIGVDQPTTSLDQLADRIAATGLKAITGRVIGDETRYDALRTGPSWPARYADQEQSGPLSALEVDDGYTLTLPAPDADVPTVRDRAGDPPATAAQALLDRLQRRGILVGGGAAGSGRAPAGAVEVAKVTSAPLLEIVHQMLTFSDNQVAEMLTKELGVAKGGGGTTEAGAAVIERRAGELGLSRAGSDVVDGSGLDPANRASCDELVATLDRSGGSDGTLGPGLPVAGKTGTLATRFRGTPAEGRLRAKTGSLADVTALAGFVPLTTGGTITFAYVANTAPVDAGLLAIQNLLGSVLADYVPPCTDVAAAPMIAPLAPYAAPVDTLSMFPLQSVLLPGALVPLHVFEERYTALVERCLAADEDFGVVLISRGSEVGGGEQRTEVGTRAKIVQAEQAPDGRWGVLAVGTERLRVQGWQRDDPHPVADVESWPDPLPGPQIADGLRSAEAQLRRLLGLRAELGEPGPPATVELGFDEPSMASHRLVDLSPLGDLDRQRLLESPTVEDRLARLGGLLDEEEQVARARLAGG